MIVPNQPTPVPGPANDPQQALAAAGLSPDQIAGVLAATAGGGGGAFQVYMPRPQFETRDPGRDLGIRVTSQYSKVNINEAYNDFLDWSLDPKKLGSFRSALIRAGLIDNENAAAAELWPIWKSLVDMAAAYTGIGKTETPWSVLARYPNASTVAARPHTTTQTSVTKVTREQAEGDVRQVVRSLLGRNPTEGQLSKLSGAYSAYFAAHPSTSTTTTTTRGDNTTSSTVTQQGATQEAAAEQIREQVEKTSEYADYQAAGFYMPLLFQALDSPVSAPQVGGG